MVQRLIGLAALLATFLATAGPVVKTEHVEAELLAEREAMQAGKASAVGLRLRMADHWHTYWKNPGDSGLPTKIQWELPQGWKAGGIQWPYPKPLPVGPLLNYGYEDEVLLVSDITPAPGTAPGRYPVKAKAEWLVCKDICIPEKGELDLTLAVAAAEGPVDPKKAIHFERARAQQPFDPSGWKFESAMQGKSLVVRLVPPAGAGLPQKVSFFPERELLIEPAAPQKLTREGNALRIEMKLAEPPLAGVTEVKGVAVSDSGWPGNPRKAMAVDAPMVAALPAAAASTSQPPPGTSSSSVEGSTWVALGFALVGGILLNLMPCVFPVLGIKVMGFVEHAHGDARAMRLQGWIFSAGVLVSFLALAGIMLALRAGGTQLGWGFQLQSPAVVMLLAALFFVLALNLSGVFEWGAFAQSMTSNVSASGRYADAFLAGVLASVVATPCTAPFMGAAVGFTLTQSAASALAVFALLGAGMALPVLLLAHFPALLRKLPKPGAWMETFKQVLAFPLYATVAWLTWVLGAQSGNDAVLAMLAGLVLIAMAAWMYGRFEHSPGPWRAAVAVLLAAAGIAVAWPAPQAAANASSASAKPGEIAWQDWSPEKVAELSAQGKAVFVDFTAAWCVTCQVNKRVALNNAAVVSAFADRQVVGLRADWTRQDPRITATLSELGRNAIPVYALYLPGEARPRLLPEVLTATIVLDEISKLPSSNPATAITQR